MCLTSSACAYIKPAVDTSEKNRAEYEATAKKLRKLAEEGDVSAQDRLGLLFKVGMGVPQKQSYGQAKRWFEEAAKQAHAEAQVNLGTLYLHGENYEEDGLAEADAADGDHILIHTNGEELKVQALQGGEPFEVNKCPVSCSNP